MLVKKIKYTDYNNVAREETFHFNLSRAECSEMDLKVPGGYAAMVESITNVVDGKRIIETFKSLILDSYGVKSDDGRTFRKSPELRDSFAQTEAYVELYVELLSDPEAAANFIKAVFPKPEATPPPSN